MGNSEVLLLPVQVEAVVLVTKLALWTVGDDGGGGGGFVME